MLAAVNAPVLLTHHYRASDEETGCLMGAMSDLGAKRARKLLEGTRKRFEYQSLPKMGHSLHGQAPAQFASILIEWFKAFT